MGFSTKLTDHDALDNVSAADHHAEPADISGLDSEPTTTTDAIIASLGG